MYSGSKGTFDDEYIRYLLDTYSTMIIRLCYSYVRSMSDAEDIAEDVFCELIKRRVVFNDDNHEKAWLLRTAANKCKNHLKSGWVSKTTPLEDNLSAQELHEYDKNLDDTRRAVLEAVMSLPEKYRTVIHLFYYSGLSIAEIAAVKRISTATAGTQLARGRELLKKKLGDDF
ncbi:MAG: sigma-70 family RNA polymerase sigma factor [Oscillospiraceae bacterium]|nr:sigma-70 family RNA polymerase sigma factor [Oscillospiraceae bacterium]